MRTAVITLAALSLAACGQSGNGTAAPPLGKGTAAPPAPIASGSMAQPAFDAIRADETIRFLGTEPFWDGTVAGGQMVYKSLENEAGQTVAVRRFAGNNGLAFSGTLDGAALDMTVTPGTCSDGMSDRSFPFTVTLKLGDRQLNGCAWTDRMPYTGPENP